MKSNEFITGKIKKLDEGWSQKYKSSINCSHPKGFSQRAHCAGKKKHNESVVMEMVCEDCGMCKTHGNIMEIKKGQKDSNGYTKCWPGKHAEGTKKSAVTGKQVRNCVPNESISEENKGLYYNVNKRKKAGTSRDADSPKAPTAQAWKDAAKTAKKESVAEGRGRPFRGVRGAFNRGDDERHDLDPTDWYFVKDGKMFAISIYPNQEREATARGYSRTRAEAKAKASEQGVAEGLNEMDKSAPQPGRDGKVSHSTYGSRDKKGSDYFKGKEAPGKPITKKQMEKHALDILKKQGVAEGGYSGIDDTDTVGFSVNSERAYNAVMARFGDQIDHDETSGILYVPARMWPKVEMVAFDADGEGAVQADGLDEGFNGEYDDLADQVYAEFERMYPNMARRADDRVIHNAIMSVLNYGGDNDPGALAGDVARAVKQQMQSGVEEGVTESVYSLEQAHAIFDDFEQAMADRGLTEDIFNFFTDEEIILETAAWRRSAGKSKKGGLNAKGVASYRRENPGSKLQMAVTTKPSKLKPGSKAAKRRKSFCARMGGVKGPMKKPNGKPTRKALALRKWNC